MITGNATIGKEAVTFRIAEKNEVVKTFEGKMNAIKGYYIIEKVNGELGVVEPDAFKQCYYIKDQMQIDNDIYNI